MHTKKWPDSQRVTSVFQLVEHRTGFTEVTCLNPTKTFIYLFIFFQAYPPPPPGFLNLWAHSDDCVDAKLDYTSCILNQQITLIHSSIPAVA